MRDMYGRVSVNVVLLRLCGRKHARTLFLAPRVLM